MWGWWGPRVRLSGLRVSGKGQGPTPAAARAAAGRSFFWHAVIAVVFLGLVVWGAMAGARALNRADTARLGPAVSPVQFSVGCAYHDRTGANSVADGDWAFVVVGGPRWSPVVEQFTCLHGRLLAAPGSPGGRTSWPSTPKPS